MRLFISGFGDISDTELFFSQLNRLQVDSTDVICSYTFIHRLWF